MNESITENLTRKLLKDFGYTTQNKITIYEKQVAKGSHFSDVFSKASKAKTGKPGYPDFIIDAPELDIVMVIECKADLNRHASASLKQIKDYAVDGAIWYTKFVSKSHNMSVAIGISGDSDEFKIDAYLYLDGKLIKVLNNLDHLPTVRYFFLLFKYSTKLTKVNDFKKVANNIHKKLYDIGSEVSDNSSFVSAILIALNNNDFRKTYNKMSDQKQLAKHLMIAMKNSLKVSNLPEDKIEILLSLVQRLPNHVLCKNRKLKKSKKIYNLLELIKEIDNNVFVLMQGNKKEIYIDEVGIFYNEFLHKAGSDGKSLGIVLTPYHICELFVELAEVNKKSIVIDLAAGTGGFLVAAMSKMLKDATLTEQNKIRKKGLIGCEINDRMFSLLASNMIVRNDGKSNIHNMDCFDWSAKRWNEEYKPNVGFLNPPYGESYDVWKFINHLLDSLEQGGIGVVIIPTSECHKSAYETKRINILKKHQLLGSFSMKSDLFLKQASVGTNILVFSAHRKQNKKSKVYFAQWKVDMLSKTNNTWVDKLGEYPTIRDKWIENFKNKVENSLSSYSKLKSNFSFSTEDYLVNRFESFNLDLIEKKVIEILQQKAKIGTLNLDIKFKKKNKKKNFNIKNWRKVKLKDLFSWTRGKTVPELVRKPGQIKYIGASMYNSGASEYITPVEGNVSSSGNVLTIGIQGDTGTCNTFYQVDDFIASGTCAILKPKIKFNEKIGAFFSALIETEKFKYSYGKPVNQEFLQTKVPLPFKDKSIDFKEILNIVDSIENSKFLSS